MYALKAGTYKFSVWCKSDSGSPLTLSKCRGRDKLMTGTLIQSITMPTTGWEQKEVTFEIEAPYKKVVDLNSGVSQMCDGYEDCVYAIRCMLICYANDTVYIANPRLQKLINN
jgi:hypothetical protein